MATSFSPLPWFGALLVLAFLAIVPGLVASACGDPSGRPPTVAEQMQLCREIEDTREAVKDTGEAMRKVPIDDAAISDARKQVRASVDYLYGASVEFEGGDDMVATLVGDLQEFDEIAATLELAAVAAGLQAQVTQIYAGLDGMLPPPIVPQEAHREKHRPVTCSAGLAVRFRRCGLQQ